MKFFRYSSRLSVFLACLACTGFLKLAGCTPPPYIPPTWPSTVVAEDRVAYYVHGLKLPGTRQALRIREGQATMWLPLKQVQFLQFTGPAREGYRPAKIELTSGSSIQIEVFVNSIIEGVTDLGYWNIPLSQVYSLEMGTD